MIQWKQKQLIRLYFTTTCSSALIVGLVANNNTVKLY